MTTRLLMEPGYTERLSRAGLNDFDAFMERRADGPPVSRHARRETVPIVLGEGNAARRCYLKRVFRVPGRHVRDDLLRLRAPHGQPWHEWKVLGALCDAGIPVVRRICVGERLRAGRPTCGFLLTEASALEHKLSDWLPPAGGCADALAPAGRHRLMLELGRLAGRLRARGFCWPDAHARHVFAGPRGGLDGRCWEFCLIDVERVSITRSPLDGTILRWLRRCLPFEPSRFEQLVFWGGFITEADLPRDADIGDARPLLSAHSHSVALRCESRLDRGGHDLEPCAPGLWLSRSRADELARIGLASSEGLLRSAVGTTLTKPGLGEDRQRVRVDVAGDGAAPYFLKRNVRPPLQRQWRRMLGRTARDSSAWREWHFIRRLAEIGIPTMHCLAVAHDMRGPWEIRSAIVTSRVSGESLERVLPPEWPRLSIRRRRALIAHVAAVARVMHKARLFHRDFYLSHLFISWENETDPVVSVIDVGRMVERPLREDRWRLKDLTALHYSTPAAMVGRVDRLRFLHNYAAHLAVPARRAERHAVFRAWIVEIEARRERMARHDRKRGRR